MENLQVKKSVDLSCQKFRMDEGIKLSVLITGFFAMLLLAVTSLTL